MVERTTVSEVTLGAQRIPAHARISAWIVSANHDARYFAQPEQFDIDRIPNRHLSFGDSGMHFCVGVCLVRLLASITLTQLVHQCHDLALPPDHVLETAKTPTAFGLKNLPLTFQPFPLS
jgi:cytochrome P450